ncbi:MAG: hypothetical protein WA268_07350 [Xanthobacteraceae bacterium]
MRIRKKIGPKAPISGKSYRQKPLDFPHQSAASAYFTVDDLGYIDLEQRTLQTIYNPFGTKLSPMS